MLIIQIALGIVLGVLILNNLRLVLQIVGVILVLCLVGVGILLACIYFKQIVGLFAIILAFSCGYFGGQGLYWLIASINQKIKKTATTRDTWVITLAILNAIFVACFYDAIPLSKNIYKFSFDNGFKDFLSVIWMSILFLWPWAALLPRAYIIGRARRKAESRDTGGTVGSKN